MLPNGTGILGVKERLRHRLRQRYLRWLARQPVAGFCRWPRRRMFCRAVRRRIYQVQNTTAFHCIEITVFAFGILLAMAFVICLPVLFGAAFIVAPENHQFANEQERSLVALTRLTGLQTFCFPLVALVATFQTQVRPKPACSELLRSRDLVRRRQWWICPMLLALGTTIASFSALIILPFGGVSVAVSIVIASAIGLLALTIGKRLLAVRPPGKLSDPGVRAAVVLTVPAFNSVLWLHPVVTRIASHLEYLGPFGWMNRKLFDVGQGDFQRLVPLALAIAAMCVAAWLVNQTTLSVTFWRKVLNLYRTEDTSIGKTWPDSRTSRHGIMDVYSSISGGFTFRRFISFACSPLHLFVAIAGLAVQGLFLGLAHWVTQIAAGNDVPTPREVTSLYLAAAHIAGWMILVTEMLLTFTWHLPALSNFSSRPLSVFGFLIDFQFAGMKRLPVQLLMAFPLLCVIAFSAWEYFYPCAASIIMAVLTCVAARTAVVAGVVYASAVANFRSWISGCLMLGMVPFMFGMLMVVFTGTGAMPWQQSLQGMVLYQVTLQLAAVAAAVAAGCLWHLVSRPRSVLFQWW